MPTVRSSLPFRDNFGAILRRPDLRILLCERIEPAGIWQFPQGGAEEGESAEETIFRELAEELGLERPRDTCRILGRGPAVRYDFPDDYHAPITLKYRGQRQVLFVMDFLGGDADFALDSHDEPEFRSFRWVTVDEGLRDFWEFKRGPFEATVAAFPHLFR